MKRALVPVVVGAAFALCAAGHASAVPTYRQTAFACCNQDVLGTTLGPDGNVWWTTDNEHAVYRIDAAGSYSLIASLSPDTPLDITTGPDGNLWLLLTGIDPNTFAPYWRVAKMTTGGAVTAYPTSGASQPSSGFGGITTGGDGALWFTETTGGDSYRIGRVTTDGAVSEYVTGPFSAGLKPCAIARGPDGDVWFTELQGGAGGRGEIARIAPDGTITNVAATNVGCGLALGPDGNLWFTDYADQSLGRISASGAISHVGSLTGNPQRLALGPDGNMWATETGRPPKVAVVTPSGKVTELEASPAYSITAGPGNTVWYGDGSEINRIAITDESPPAPPPPVEGKTVNASTDRGTVLVKLPAGAGGRFVPLSDLGGQIPVGSTVDTTRGMVHLRVASGRTGRTQDGHFSRGIFIVKQARRQPLTTLILTGGNLNSCSRLPAGGAPKAVAGVAARERSLFSRVRGHFRTRGRNSAATSRGTEYLVKDTCAGTLTRVGHGTVRVRDFTLRKTVNVTARHAYFARSPKRARRR